MRCGGRSPGPRDECRSPHLVPAFTKKLMLLANYFLLVAVSFATFIVHLGCAGLGSHREFDKSWCAGCGARLVCQPVSNAAEIERNSREHMLEMGFGEADIA